MKTSRIRDIFDLHNALGELDFRIRLLEENSHATLKALQIIKEILEQQQEKLDEICTR